MAVGDKALIALLMLPFVAGGAAGYGYEATTNPQPTDIANTGKEMELASLENDITQTRRKSILNELKRKAGGKSAVKREAGREVRI